MYSLMYAVKQGERSGLLMGLCVHRTDMETWLRDSLRLSLAVCISLDLVSDIYGVHGWHGMGRWRWDEDDDDVKMQKMDNAHFQANTHACA